ncbi:MAG: hypothetical protein IPP14_15760 [Planctomycetes bacterium]|nr:hypothetical protein [Planctomycetota bacterium]
MTTEQNMTDLEFQTACDAMRTAGESDGKNAGSWVIDGNTSDETRARIAQGMVDSDPEVLDALPSLQLGEWAGDPTLEELVADYTDVDPESCTPEELEELFQAYSDGWYQGMNDEVERNANA